MSRPLSYQRQEDSQVRVKSLVIPRVERMIVQKSRQQRRGPKSVAPKPRRNLVKKSRADSHIKAENTTTGPI